MDTQLTTNDNNEKNANLSDNNEDILETAVKADLDKIIPPEDITTDTRKEYVLGFALTPDKEKVLLITKNRPVWQEGLLNGIGGKVEEYDKDAHHAISREFMEETGITIPPEHWNKYGVMEGKYFYVSLFWCFSEQLHTAQSITDEIVSLEEIQYLLEKKFKVCIPNLSILIGTLLDDNLENLNIHLTYNN
jgi:8-oxo-dGTP diphosphatase